MGLLVVDDEVECAAALAKLLRRRGWESGGQHGEAADALFQLIFSAHPG